MGLTDKSSTNNYDCRDERIDLQLVEKSIIKRYRKDLWNKFTKAVREFEMVENGDRVAVAISGGKDSLLMAKLFQELQLHGEKDFDLEFIAMDPGYNKDSRDLLEENCHYLNIPVKIFDTDIFEITDKIADGYPCYMCAKMRRGALYSFAKDNNCNKLALGHHFDDVIETIMLNILYAGSFKTMLPKLKSTNFENMELIRPLYYVEERSIIRFIEYTGVVPLNCACSVAAKKIGSKRAEIKQLIENLKKEIPNVDKNILKSSVNVYKDAILGWIEDGNRESYLEKY